VSASEPKRRPLHGHLHKLHGVRLKLNRAQEHADALRADIGAWFARHPYEVYGVYEAGPPEEYVFRVRFLEPVPPTWAIVLGDFAHNARSALDHLAYVIVLENNGGRDEYTQFPIALSPFAWEREAHRGIRNASVRHREIIETFQPYHRPDLHGRKWIFATIDDPLAILHRLSNIDKHSVLHATPAAIQAIGFNFVPVRDIATVANQYTVPSDFLEDDGVLIRVGITSDGPEPLLRLRRQETVEIRVQYRVDLLDSYTLQNVPLLETMDSILERVRELYQVFVDELK